MRRQQGFLRPPRRGGGPAQARPRPHPSGHGAAVRRGAGLRGGRLSGGAGALAALCSNLARGCEKQYKDQEAALFREIAGFFAAAAPQVENGDLDRLAAMVQEDLDAGYPALRASAQGEGDRGALRICTWGEKVTGILSTLLKRYQQEGESLLENTQVWVCTVCGFIYIGDQAPALCPVCKVPAWKFEEIEGRG